MTTDVGVLIVNLGSPASSDVSDVREYLREFLHDPYVIDIHPYLRWLLVDGIILRLRPRRSAEAYRTVWTSEGSPLIVLTERLCEKLRTRTNYPVYMAMRYGQPSIERIIRQMASDGIGEIVLVPMYPQYAMATTRTVVEETQRVLRDVARELRMRIVPPFYADDGFVDAFVEGMRRSLDTDPDHMLLSYHGLPIRHLRKTDPTGHTCMRSQTCCERPSDAHATCYRHQCAVTSQQLMARAGMEHVPWTMTFQSRLGSDAWLTPSTQQTAVDLARSGVKHLAIACPSFVTDCLETLEEIAHGVQHAFRAAGGERVTVIPCPNDSDSFADAVAAWRPR